MPGYVPRWASINLLVSVIAPNTRRMGFENLVGRHTALLRHQPHRHPQRVGLLHHRRLLFRRPAPPRQDRRDHLCPIDRTSRNRRHTPGLGQGVHLVRFFRGRFSCRTQAIEQLDRRRRS